MRHGRKASRVGTAGAVAAFVAEAVRLIVAREGQIPLMPVSHSGKHGACWAWCVYFDVVRPPCQHAHTRWGLDSLVHCSLCCTPRQ